MRSRHFGRTLATILVVLLVTVSTAAAQDYGELRDEIEAQRIALASDVGPQMDGEAASRVRRSLRRSIERLFDAWAGTSWGMGLPQTQVPGEGKINCGMFVGTVLAHVGFDIDHRKLQRQPSELIVKTLAPKDEIRRFRNASMSEFLEGVRELGPGLFVIGLDYHVGFLAVQPDGRVRFIHAGLYSKVVADQDPRDAPELSESRYKVVGKILDDEMLGAWLQRASIDVIGNW